MWASEPGALKSSSRGALVILKLVVLTWKHHFWDHQWPKECEPGALKSSSRWALVIPKWVVLTWKHHFWDHQWPSRMWAGSFEKLFKVSTGDSKMNGFDLKAPFLGSPVTIQNVSRELWKALQGEHWRFQNEWFWPESTIFGITSDHPECEPGALKSSSRWALVIPKWMVLTWKHHFWDHQWPSRMWAGRFESFSRWALVVSKLFWGHRSPTLIPSRIADCSGLSPMRGLRISFGSLPFRRTQFVNIWLLPGLGANHFFWRYTRQRCVFLMLSISSLNNGPLLRSFATSKVRQPDRCQVLGSHCWRTWHWPHRNLSWSLDSWPSKRKNGTL